MGNRGKGKRETASKPQSFYALSEVRDLIDQRRVDVRPNALDDAQRDFGWETSDILDALKRLQPKHFYKSDASAKKYGVVLDFYKACGLKGEDVYTHFYIDDEKGVLVVNSLKRI
jgi:hypothetical protein